MAAHAHARAGDTGREIVVLPGIDTIDASEIDTNMVGHSYYAENRSVIADIFSLIHDNLPPSKRFGLKPVSVAMGIYWLFSR